MNEVQLIYTPLLTNPHKFEILQEQKYSLNYVFYLRHIYLILHLLPPQSHSTILDKKGRIKLKSPTLEIIWGPPVKSVEG